MKRHEKKTVRPILPETIIPIFVGVDPGKSGAICAIDSNMKILNITDYPSNEFLCSEIIHDYNKQWNKDKFKIFAAIENVHAMPGQGVTSMFTFGQNFMVWKMGFAMVNITFLRPSPQKWMTGLIPKKKNATIKEKNRAHLAVACQLFPDYKYFFTGPRGGIKTDRCAAALIAYWRRQQYYKGG